MSLWSKIGSFFAGIFGRGTPARALVDGIRAVDRYLPEIYQVVAWLAEITPTRADDEIIRAAQKLGVPQAIAGRHGGEALAAIVLAWARRKWPDAPERRIRRAIEIAYGVLKP